jgi:Flp pilus assembly CpaE family ATPase
VGKHTLTVLLIEDNPDFAHLVQRWLASTSENEFDLNWTDTLAAGMSRLQKGDVDVILLDLGLPDSSGIETYTQTHAHAPRTPTLVLTASDSHSLALQTIQKGAEDYLVKSNCDSEALIRALRYAVVRHKSQLISERISPPSGRVVGVIGAKGGVGTTTIACTLASELRRQTGQEVLLADLDPDGGNISFLTGIDSKYSVQEVAQNVQRLDLQRWEAIMTQMPDGLKVISSGGRPGDDRLHTESFREVLKFTRPLYRWTVLDLGRLNRGSLTLLESVNEMLLVTTPAIPSLYNAKLAIESLRTAAVETERIRMIVNHTGEPHPASRIELNNMFGIPVFATIPNDADELFIACVEKRLAGPRSHLRQAVAGIARKLAGLEEQPGKAKFASLLGIAERFRKPAERVSLSSGSRT